MTSIIEISRKYSEAEVILHKLLGKVQNSAQESKKTSNSHSNSLGHFSSALLFHAAMAMEKEMKVAYDP